MTDEQEILSELNDGVLILRFNRPKRKNAFNSSAWLSLQVFLNDAREDKSIACVVLTGAGADFSSGMDLTDFAGNEGVPLAEQPFYKAQQALLDFDKPLIGAAKGIAVGGGATMLLHCDVVYVGESLRMRLPFVSLGLVPELAASYTLQNSIGIRRANELFFTAEWIDAGRAVETGIATRCYQDEELLDQALSKAFEIAQWPVRALQETKRCLKAPHREALELVAQLEQEGMSRLAMSPENIEAVTAIFEKREPDFKQFR